MERDLHAWAPASMVTRVLAEGVQRDLEKVRELAAAWSGSPIEARTQHDWFYIVLRARLGA